MLTVVSGGISRERRSASSCVGAVMVNVMRILQMERQRKELPVLQYASLRVVALENNLNRLNR